MSNERKKTRAEKELEKAQKRRQADAALRKDRRLNETRSVLRFIDAHLDRVPDPVELARELGYTDEAGDKLKEKHGERLLPYLKGVQKARADEDRFMARQQGHTHPEQYVSSREGAIDDAATVPKHYESRLDDHRLRTAGELVSAMEDTAKALSKRLEDTRNPLVEGELKRALRQIERARDKAIRQLRIYELDKAA